MHKYTALAAESTALAAPRTNESWFFRNKTTTQTHNQRQDDEQIDLQSLPQDKQPNTPCKPTAIPVIAVPADVARTRQPVGDERALTHTAARAAGPLGTFLHPL